MSIDIDLAENIFKAIDNIIDKRLNELHYNYFIEGKIVKDNENGTYDVDINEQKHTISAKNGKTFAVGDIVLIQVPNSNYHEKFIECKRL